MRTVWMRNREGPRWIPFVLGQAGKLLIAVVLEICLGCGGALAGQTFYSGWAEYESMAPEGGSVATPAWIVPSPAACEADDPAGAGGCAFFVIEGRGVTALPSIAAGEHGITIPGAAAVGTLRIAENRKSAEVFVAEEPFAGQRETERPPYRISLRQAGDGDAPCPLTEEQLAVWVAAEALYAQAAADLRREPPDPLSADEALQAAYDLPGPALKPGSPAAARFAVLRAEALALQGQREKAKALLSEQFGHAKDEGTRVVLERRLLLGGMSAERGTALQEYVAVKVYYATNRRFAPAGEGMPDFGHEMDEALSMGVCEVSIPKTHRMGEVEEPSIYRLESTVDPSQHVALLSLTRESPEAFFAAMRDDQARGRSRDVVIFIHGYNVSFSRAVRRMGQMVYDLGFAGVPVVFSWPSAGSVSEYASDGEKVVESIPALHAFMRSLLREITPRNVHVIAHSMGNRVLSGALQALAKEAAAQGRAKIRNVVLAAPDIDAQVFRERIFPSFRKTAEKTTLYASSKDVALILSKIFNRALRLGDSFRMTVLPDMDSVDVSSVDSSLLGHSYYGSNEELIHDIAELLGGRKAEERPWLRPARTPEGGLFWMFL